MLRIIREVLYFQLRQQRTDGGSALEYLLRISRRRMVCFLVSDFPTSGYDQPLRLAYRRHDVIPVSITDRREVCLPRLGFVTLRDLEIGALMVLDTGSCSDPLESTKSRCLRISRTCRPWCGSSASGSGAGIRESQRGMDDDSSWQSVSDY